MNKQIEIKIDKDFECLLPALTDNEYNQLHDNIKTDCACMQDLVLWDGYNTIIDGHNRYKIMTELGIKPKYTTRFFHNKEAVKQWMIKNQIGRRNLTLEQKNILIAQLTDCRKQEITQNKQDHERILNDMINKGIIQKGITEKQQDKAIDNIIKSDISKELNISEPQIDKAIQYNNSIEKIENKADIDLKGKILNNNIEITQNASNQLLKKDKEVIKDVINNAENNTKITEKVIDKSDVKINGDNNIDDLGLKEFEITIKIKIKSNNITEAKIEARELKELLIENYNYDKDEIDVRIKENKINKVKAEKECSPEYINLAKYLNQKNIDKYGNDNGQVWDDKRINSSANELRLLIEANNIKYKGDFLTIDSCKILMDYALQKDKLFVIQCGKSFREKVEKIIQNKINEDIKNISFNSGNNSNYNNGRNDFCMPVNRINQVDNKGDLDLSNVDLNNEYE